MSFLRTLLDGLIILVSTVTNLFTGFIRTVTRIVKPTIIRFIKTYIKTSSDDGITMCKYKSWKKERFYY